MNTREAPTRTSGIDQWFRTGGRIIWFESPFLSLKLYVELSVIVTSFHFIHSFRIGSE